MENEHSYANIRLSKNANLEEGDNMATESEEAMKSQELAGSVRGEIFVYRQDVVICPKYEGLLGVVTEVAGDADSEGSITDSDSEDEENEANANSGGDADGGVDGAGGNANGGMNCGEGYDTLPDGQVRVIWADASETAENVIDVAVVDRTFLHGDIVALASDPTGQLGLVVDVDIRIVLLDSDKKETKQVSSKELKRVREPLVGDYVILGPWLGRVDDVLDNVTVLFDDGSICKVVKADPLRLKPLARSVSDDASCPFYPGQRVKGVSSSVFKSSRWLSGLWKANRLEGTVIKVEAASVVVYWIASAHLGMGTNSSVPSEEQDPKNLTLLSCFSYANWQLGDWCHLPSRPSQIRKESVEGSSSHIEHQEECSFGEHAEVHMNSCMEGPDDALDGPGSVLGDHQAVQDEFLSGDPEGQELEGKIQLQGHDLTILHETNKIGECGSCSSSSSVSKEQAHESWPAYRKKLRKVFFKREKKPRKREESFDRALSIVKITTKVDVAWQDGTREYGLESKTLIPINTPNDHEFFPEQYVVENATGEDDPSGVKRVGVVRSLNSKERTVCVRWLKPVSSPEDLREFDTDEIVSAYELDEHPDYDYCYGDVVVRLSPVSVPATTADCGNSVEQLEQHASMGEAKANQDEVEQTGNDGAYEDFSILSWVGNITGLQDGDIEVTWADGMVSKVGPQAVFVVGREDDSDSFDGGSEISDDAASWETVDENDVDKLDDAEKESDKQSPSDNNVERENQVEAPPEESTVGISGPLSVPLAALGFVSRLATGLFSRDRKQSSPSETEPGTSEVSDIGADEGELSNDESNDVGSLSAPDASGSAERDSHMAASEDGEPMDTSSSVDSSFSFKHFDIAESSLDHHFVASVQNSGERKWAKKVQKDWSILEKNLPDAIYVRVYEDRMDLLRAVIVGACGTPYQDGLFFFDFYLPPEYPQVPPSAYYHSGGLRVNPNLYVDGKVCLSLLNTWTGRGNEVWDPSSSSILQVLVSLQGLVLNSKPYFNEAGYEKQVGTVEGEKNALPYNEHTYLLNLKSMLFLLRRPPMHFEGFVKDHFRSRGQYILKACEAYMEEGCTIGSLTKDACMTEKSGEHPCSVGFKLMLGKILPRLMSALTEAGVDCRQFNCLRTPDSLPQS